MLKQWDCALGHINSRHGSIFRFDLEHILSCEENTMATPEHISYFQYFNFYEKNFAVLPDQSTIFGVKNASKTVLMMDDITGSTPARVVAEHKRQITMIQPDCELAYLFVGDLGRTLVQYALAPGYSMLRVVKDYGRLGIGWLISGGGLGRFAVIGGNKSRVRVVDIRGKCLCEGLLETAIGYIYSLKVCQVSETQVVLSVVGSSPDYSDSKSDLYDVSGLMSLHSKTLPEGNSL